MKALVVLRGDIVLPRESYDIVCCCDGAFDLLRAPDPTARVDLVVGDFDTCKTRPDGAEIVRVPVRKDYTDGELAIRTLAERGVRQIDLTGLTGGPRPEHVYTNVFLFPLCASLGIAARGLYPKGKLLLGSGRMQLDLRGIATVSLAPLFGEAHISDTKGLFYPARDLTLTPDRTIGVGNVPTAPTGEIVVDRGRVLIVLEHAEEGA